MSNVNELVVGYLATWNERDSKRRRELIAKIWAEDGAYIDAHRRGVVHSAATGDRCGNPGLHQHNDRIRDAGRRHLIGARA
jgi:hypothetical protein